MKTSYPQLASVLILISALHAPATVLYVDVNSTNPTPPYTNWATAATVIQDAVNAASPDDTILVTNGVYETGGRWVKGSMMSRVMVTIPITVQSVNGPALTVIRGYQVPETTNGDSAVRCAYLKGGASLIGFTLANGATLAYESTPGGGVWCDSTSEVLSNCVLVGNWAYHHAGAANSGTLINCMLLTNTAGPGGWDGYCSKGGGAYASILKNCTLIGNVAYDGGGSAGGTLNNCLLMGNTAHRGGGGAQYGTLNNCTVVGNSAGSFAGGVAYGDLLNNCVVYYNTAPANSNYDAGTWNYCCTEPLPASGAGNFTGEPLFIDLAGGDLRLLPNSRCINSGDNQCATDATDLDGNPRIMGGTVDIGAYEFQGQGVGRFADWLQQYALPTDHSADYIDSDSDGLNNWQEWIAGTIPTNALSILKLSSPTGNVFGITIGWQSVAGKTYYLQRGTNLAAQPAFLSIQSNVVGQVGTTAFTDSTATNAGPYFYQVGVQ